MPRPASWGVGLGSLVESRVVGAGDLDVDGELQLLGQREVDARRAAAGQLGRRVVGRARHRGEGGRAPHAVVEASGDAILDGDLVVHREVRGLLGAQRPRAPADRGAGRDGQPGQVHAREQVAARQLERHVAVAALDRRGVHARQPRRRRQRILIGADAVRVHRLDRERQDLGAAVGVGRLVERDAPRAEHRAGGVLVLRAEVEAEREHRGGAGVGRAPHRERGADLHGGRRVQPAQVDARGVERRAELPLLLAAERDRHHHVREHDVKRRVAAALVAGDQVRAAAHLGAAPPAGVAGRDELAAGVRVAVGAAFREGAERDVALQELAVGQRGDAGAVPLLEGTGDPAAAGGIGEVAVVGVGRSGRQERGKGEEAQHAGSEIQAAGQRVTARDPVPGPSGSQH